jgi:hypothetical protein
MQDTRRTALEGASPKRRQIGSGGASSASGAPAASATTPPQGPQPGRASKAPPGFAPGEGTTAAKKRKRLFGR